MGTGTVIFITMGLISFIITGAIAENKKKSLWLLFLFLACGLISMYLGLESYSKIPNGLPPELKADGLYEVRIVDVYKEKDGSQWVAVQIIKEEGKTIERRLPYKKISKAKFGNANIVYGIPMTIELKTFPSQQYLAVK